MNEKMEKFLPPTRIQSANVKIQEMLLGYLAAPFCAMIANAVFASYLNRYYVDVLGWTKFGVFASLLPIVSSFVVILGNLMVGQWIDNTRTAAGKARPYLILSIPLVAAAVLLLFMTPTGAGSGAQMLWIAVTYNLYYALAYPCYYTAHSSLVSLSTRNANQRGLLATLSNASTVAAAGVGASILAPILLQPFMFVSGPEGIDMAASYRNWRVLSIAFALLSAAGIVLEYFFTRERITEEAMTLNLKEEKIPMRKHIEACTKDRCWWLVILFVLVFQFGQLCKNSSMSFYSRWMFDSVINAANPENASAALMSTLGLVGGLPSAVGMFIAWPLANKLGKKRSIVIGLAFALAGGLVAFVNVNSFPVVVFAVVLKGIGIIPAQYVMLALISDILDHLEAKNGFRSDGFTMSLYSSIMVGLGGLGMGIINAMLTFSGYSNVGYPVDPATVTLIDNLESWTGGIIYRQLGGTEDGSGAGVRVSGRGCDRLCPVHSAVVENGRGDLCGGGPAGDCGTAEGRRIGRRRRLGGAGRAGASGTGGSGPQSRRGTDSGTAGAVCAQGAGFRGRGAEISGETGAEKEQPDWKIPGIASGNNAGIVPG